MTEQELCEVFESSRAMDKAKAEILLFMALFVRPLNRFVKWEWKQEALITLKVKESRSGREADLCVSVEHGDRKNSVTVGFAGLVICIIEHGPDGHSYSGVETGNFPSRYIPGLRCLLTELFEKLDERFNGELRQEADFYRNSRDQLKMATDQ